MSHTLLSLSGVVLAVNVAVAAILVSGFAMLVERCVRTCALPLRHGLLCLAMVLTLAIPLAAWLARGWGVGLVAISVDLPARIVTSDSRANRTEETSSSTGTHKPLRSRSNKLGELRDADRPPIPAFGSPTEPPDVESSRLSASQLLRADSVENIRIAGSVLVLIWGVIAFWSALRLAQGMYMVARLRRSLKPIADPRVIEAARQAFAATGVNAHRPVLESPLVHSPLTLCWWRPLVVMPRGLADALDDEQLACVLAHEAAHVARHDTAVALLQRLAGVVFWWNPLLHAVNRRINGLREQLCDQFVVWQRGDGVPLAEAIVRVAEWSAACRAPLPLAISLLDDAQDLEQRITRLTEKYSLMSIRLNKKSIMALGVFTFALVAILMVPMLRAQIGVSERAAAPDASAEEEPPAAAVVKDPAKEAKETTALIRLSGRARDTAGKPVAGAKIYLVSTNGIDKELGETTTDADGKYSFRDVNLPINQRPRTEPGGTFQVYGDAEEFGFAWHGMRHYQPRPRPADRPHDDNDFGFYQGEEIEVDLTFRPAATLTGSVKDENGRPVANARFSLFSLDYLETEGRELHHNYREFWAQYFAPPRFREVRTGDDGRFTFRGIPADTAGYAFVEHPDFASQSFFAAVTDKPITEYRFISVSSVTIVAGKTVHMPIWETRTVNTSPLDINVNSVRRVLIDVVTDDKEAPAKDIRIGASSGVDFATGTHASGTTDVRGRTELKLPPGNYRLVADPPRDTTYVRTYGALNATAEPREQTAKLRLKAGCILILKAVDAANGSPIADVSFWHDVDDADGGGRTSVQSLTNYVDHPVTNAKGELRAVVMPGTRHYGVGLTPLPKGYRADRESRTQLVKCEEGKTIRVQFKLTRQ